MGLEDLGNAAKDALNNDDVKNKLSDGVDSAADFAKDKTGGKFDDQIDQGADAVQQKLGGEG